MDLSIIVNTQTTQQRYSVQMNLGSITHHNKHKRKLSKTNQKETTHLKTQMHDGVLCLYCLLVIPYLKKIECKEKG